MTNEKGSIIVVVLMLLGVVGLVGVTLMTQSRMDLQFSQSTRTYDRIFGSADGAASYALRWLSQDMTTRRAVRDALAAVPGYPAPGTQITVQNLPNDLQNSSAVIILERFQNSPGGSEPHHAYLRIRGEAFSPVWGGADSGGNPTSTVEISVDCPIPNSW